MQSCVDKIIVIIEARKQDVFDAVGNQATKSLESLSQKKDDVEKLKLDLLKRSLVLKSRDSVKHSIQSFRNSTKENRDTECILRFSFTKSEKLINLLSMSERIGKVEFVFSETKVQQSAFELFVVVIVYGHLGEVLSFE